MERGKDRDGIDEYTLEVSLTVPFGCSADIILPFKTEQEPRHAGPGKFTLTYQTDVPMRKVYTIDMTLNELLSAPKVKAALIKMMPQLLQTPESYRNIPFRQLIMGFAKSGQAQIGETQIEGLDRMLRGIL